MNTFQHVLLSTLLILVIYLAAQNQQLRAELHTLTELQQDAAATMTDTLAPLMEKITAISAVTDKLGKEADAETSKKLGALQKRLDLYGILTSIDQANRLRAESKGTEAAEKLGGVKKPIWQAGDALPTHKARLQGLMQPIDKLVSAWKSGDTSTAPDNIRKELEAVLGELGK